MHAMILEAPKQKLEWQEVADPIPGPGEIRVKVSACGVCRTDLHVVDGELPHPKSPIIPGHEIVGRIDAIGAGVEGFRIGQRVGIPWLGHTCGVCPYCVGGHENLCDYPLFTGYTRDGGFATIAIADARYTFPLGDSGEDASLAPFSALALSAGVHWSWRVKARSWVSMVSARLHISLHRSHDGKGVRFSLSHVQAILALRLCS
jgi:propanol-preferring alcohol dehydrogenase